MALLSCVSSNNASRALAPMARRYEKHSLIVWGLHLYLYGSEFELQSDHKPLQLIFHNPKSRPSARIEHCMPLRLQSYSFTVKHTPGITNPADHMSRHPTDVQLQCHEEIDADEYMKQTGRWYDAKASVTEEFSSTSQSVLKSFKCINCRPVYSFEQ